MQTDRKKKIIQEFIKISVISPDRKAAFRKESDVSVRGVFLQYLENGLPFFYGILEVITEKFFRKCQYNISNGKKDDMIVIQNIIEKS